MPTLSAANNGVSNAKNLDVFIGDPPRHMMILTGIAIPRLASDDDDDNNPVQHETVIIKLGQTAIQQPKEWTAVVGLTNISNTESDFIFALDKVTTLQLGSDGELELWVDIGVQGDDSVLNAFSYQVTMLVEARDVGLKSIQVSDNIPITPGGFGDPGSGGLGDPPAGPAALQWGSDAAVSAGFPWRLRVELDGPAPGPGVPVSISSSDSADVPVPMATVFIQPGHTTSDESLSPPTRNDLPNTPITATIFASHLGQTRTALIHVKPNPK
jgi:hypothetical protein